VRQEEKKKRKRKQTERIGQETFSSTQLVESFQASRDEVEKAGMESNRRRNEGERGDERIIEDPDETSE